MARKKAKALPPKMITVYAEILQETEDGLLVRCDEEADGVWLPKSQINYDGERGDIGVEIEIPDWLADEKGFFDGMGKSEATSIGEAIGAVVDGLKPQQPETVTLSGVLAAQHDTEFQLAVPNGQGEYDYHPIARDAVLSSTPETPVDGEAVSFTLSLAYAVEAGIVAAPEEDAAPARTCETCIHYDCTNLSCEGPWDDECSTDKLNPAYLARWEPLAEPEKACNACAHLDFAADNNACEGCGDDLSNFTPLAAAEPQGQPESVEAVQ